MTWQGVDFMGISLNDRSLVTKLDEFLKTHEEHISHALVHQVRHFTGGSDLDNKPLEPLQFDGAIKQIYTILQAAQTGHRLPKNQEQWGGLLKSINSMLWEQVELVEGFVSELFHQLSYVSVLKWQASLKDIVEGFSQILVQHIHVTKKCVNSLSELFKSVCTADKDKPTESWWKSLWPGSNESCVIDKELLTDLQNCEEILKNQTQSFIDQFSQFEKVSIDVNERAQKLKGYEVLFSLGEGYGEQYNALYRFLKMWEGLSSAQAPSQETLLRSFQYFSRDKTFSLLKAYYHALEQALYDKSRTLKTSPRHLFVDALGRTFIMETVKGYRNEVHTLGSLIGKLRDFLLKSDPDPYIRSRWGFSDTPVGNPPKYSDKLVDLNLNTEQLDHGYEKLLKSLEQGPPADEKLRLSQLDDRLSKVVHLMAQPLISSSHFKSNAEKAMDIMEEVNELGSYGRESVDYVRYGLGKLLRFDWKEHVLTTLHRFQRLFKVHEGIIGQTIDKAHEKRLERFDYLLSQVKKKIRNHETAHEIDYDINDIKAYLQDFLATLQRSVNDESIGPKRALRHIEEGAQQLLEYRYKFGEFFASLKDEPEGYYVRQQFLFVDQYFEAIENKIYEIRLQRGLVAAEE